MTYLNPEHVGEVGPIAAIEFNLGRKFDGEFRRALVVMFRDEAVEAIREWAAAAMDGRPGGEEHAKMEARIADHLAACREAREGGAR